MQSSRMRTGRSLAACRGGVSALGGGGGGIPACTEADPTPLWTESQTQVKT